MIVYAILKFDSEGMSRSFKEDPGYDSTRDYNYY